MVAVAIFSIDPGLRRDLEKLPGDDPAVVIVGMADQLSSLRELVDRNRVDVLVADTPTRELLAEYRARHDRIALVVLLEGEDAEAPLQALGAGASAAIDRRPAVMRSSQLSRRSPLGLSSCRRTSLRRCSPKHRLPTMYSRPMVPGAPD
jgi:DNA-binding NarL/FixJ family response regulator